MNITVGDKLYTVFFEIRFESSIDIIWISETIVLFVHKTY
jgi:hypothetical protein